MIETTSYSVIIVIIYIFKESYRTLPNEIISYMCGYYHFWYWDVGYEEVTIYRT